MNTVEVRNITAGYRGSAVIKNIDLVFNNNNVYVVIGPNGSGKTTLLRVLSGVLKPIRGDVLVNGISIFKNSGIKRIIGYMPSDIGLLPTLTLYENLRIFANLLGYGDEYIMERLDVIKKYVEVDDIIYVKFGSMSTGQRIRAGLIRTLIHDPKIIILDEPTRGLDPLFADHVRTLIKELARDRIVIMTSHLIHEVLELSNYVVFLKDGELVFSGVVDDFKKLLLDKPLTIHVKTATSIDDLLAGLNLDFSKKALCDYMVRLPSYSMIPILFREIVRYTNVIDFREDLDEVVKILYRK